MSANLSRGEAGEAAGVASLDSGDRAGRAEHTHAARRVGMAARFDFDSRHGRVFRVNPETVPAHRAGLVPAGWAQARQEDQD
jgi:hypothetical protein